MIPPRYYFAGFNSPAENIVILRVKDYNDPVFEHETVLTADFFAHVDWRALLEFYNRHSLEFLLKDPVVAPVKNPKP